MFVAETVNAVSFLHNGNNYWRTGTIFAEKIMQLLTIGFFRGREYVFCGSGHSAIPFQWLAQFGHCWRSWDLKMRKMSWELLQIQICLNRNFLLPFPKWRGKPEIVFLILFWTLAFFFFFKRRCSFCTADLWRSAFPMFCLYTLRYGMYLCVCIWGGSSVQGPGKFAFR